MAEEKRTRTVSEHEVCMPKGETAECSLYEHPSIIIGPSTIPEATLLGRHSEPSVDVPPGTLGIAKETATAYVMPDKPRADVPRAAPRARLPNAPAPEPVAEVPVGREASSGSSPASPAEEAGAE